MKSIKHIALCLLLLTVGMSSVRSAELCIEKSTLNIIKLHEPVLGYFVGSVSYLLRKEGGNVISEFKDKPPYFKDDIKSAVLFSLNQSTTESLKLAYESQGVGSTIVKKAGLSAVLWQQFKALTGTPANIAHDFVIFQSFPPRPVTVDILVSVEGKSSPTLTPHTRSYSPAFFSQADAKQFQEQLNAMSKVKYDRLTLDFSTFLREFMVPQLNSSAPFVVFGEDGVNLMQQFNLSYK